MHLRLRAVVTLAAALLLSEAAGAERAASPSDAFYGDLYAIEAGAPPDAADGAREAFADEPVVLDPVRVIRLTVKLSPEIRRAYERKVTEESRYDFFIVSREQLSYGTVLGIDYDRYHTILEDSDESSLAPQVFVRKEFYDTSSASLRVGYDLDEYPDGHEGNAYVSGGVSLPLFASREALQRSNDRIYKENDVNDARLDYVREIRDEVRQSLDRLSFAQRNQEALRYDELFIKDLDALMALAAGVKDRDTTFDQAKIQATLSSANADIDEGRQQLLVSIERLKTNIGMPFDVEVAVTSDGFRPMEGRTQDELERIALGSDEEIKTLLNSIKNSQAELQLARKGKWDTSLFVEGYREFAGSGGEEGNGNYGVATGVAVTRIDGRISKNLERIALASIRAYRNAIVARRREIRANTIEAYSTLVAQTAAVRAREDNLGRYESDFRKGVEEYRAGLISADELISKRRQLRQEQHSIAWARLESREALAALLAATGRYEDFLGASAEPRAPEDAAESAETAADEAPANG